MTATMPTVRKKHGGAVAALPMVPVDEDGNYAGVGGTLSAEYNATPPTYTDGAASTLQTDDNGRLLVSGDLATVAHDSPDTGDPLKIGLRAKSSLSGATAVSAEDRTDAMGDLDGTLITRTTRSTGCTPISSRFACVTTCPARQPTRQTISIASLTS